MDVENTVDTGAIPVITGGQSICDQINYMLSLTFVRIEYYSPRGMLEIKFVSPVGSQFMMLHGSINGQSITIPVGYDEPLTMYPARSLHEWRQGIRPTKSPDWFRRQ
jgi:hypothetical protein